MYMYVHCTHVGAHIHVHTYMYTVCSCDCTVYLGLVEEGAVSLDGVSQPHFQTLGKVTYGLRESSRDGT